MKRINLSSADRPLSPEFLELIAQSRAQFAAGRKPSLDEMRRAVLPRRSPTGLRSLATLPEEELDALIERTRQRASDLSEDEVAAIIAEAVRAVRTQSRS